MPISEEINTSSWTDFSVFFFFFSIKIRHFIFISSIEYPLNFKTSILWFLLYCDLWKKTEEEKKMKMKFTLENELNHIFNVKNDIRKFRNQMIVMACWPKAHRLSAMYFFSNYGFIQNQQRIEIQALQSWWAMCTYPHIRRRSSHLWKRKGRQESYSNQWVHGSSLAESLSEKKSLSSSCWTQLSWEGMKTTSLAFQLYFNFLFINFYKVQHN